jgi:hypothetical protein
MTRADQSARNGKTSIYISNSTISVFKQVADEFGGDSSGYASAVCLPRVLLIFLSEGDASAQVADHDLRRSASRLHHGTHSVLL